MAKTRVSDYDIMRIFFGDFLALQHPELPRSKMAI
jgi:hypothetical protein